MRTMFSQNVFAQRVFELAGPRLGQPAAGFLSAADRMTVVNLLTKALQDHDAIHAFWVRSDAELLLGPRYDQFSGDMALANSLSTGMAYLRDRLAAISGEDENSYWTDDDRMNYQAFQRAVTEGTALAVQGVQTPAARQTPAAAKPGAKPAPAAAAQPEPKILGVPQTGFLTVGGIVVGGILLAVILR